MDQSDFRDSNTGLCKSFDNKAGRLLVVNVDDPVLFDYYLNKSCYKGNIYADYCEYCARETCIYYKPKINLVPIDQGLITILSKEEVNKMLGIEEESLEDKGNDNEKDNIELPIEPIEEEVIFEEVLPIPNKKIIINKNQDIILKNLQQNIPIKYHRDNHKKYKVNPVILLIYKIKSLMRHV